MLFFFFEKKCETFTNNIYILALLMMMCYQVLIVGLCFDVDTGVFSYGMVTTMMLDAWRLLFGALNPPPESTTSIVEHAICLPWWK